VTDLSSVLLGTVMVSPSESGGAIFSAASTQDGRCGALIATTTPREGTQWDFIESALSAREPSTPPIKLSSEASRAAQSSAWLIHWWFVVQRQAQAVRTVHHRLQHFLRDMAPQILVNK